MAPIGHVSDAQVAELADVLRLVGEPSRLRILMACLAGPESVSAIVVATGIPRSLVSHHLRLLRASRLLRTARRGRSIFYSVADERVRCIVTDLVAHVQDAESASADAAASRTHVV